MSSVLLSISQWLARGEDLVSIFQAFCTRKGIRITIFPSIVSILDIDILFCMLAYEVEDKSFNRDLILFNPANSKVDISVILQKYDMISCFSFSLELN
jgi:hypothetical protein